MKRIAILAYGGIIYVAFLLTFVYAMFFIEGMLVPTTLASGGPSGSLQTALLVNVGLLGAFAVQHNIMARRWFKERWTRIIPAAAERSTYVLQSALFLGLALVAWQPLPATICWSSSL